MNDEPSTALLHPISGELLDTNDVDGLIDAWEDLQALEQRLRAARLAMATALAAQAPREGDCRTTRLRGNRRKVRIEYPADSWDQSMLKEAWNAFPAWRDEYLRIVEVGVKLREYAKMARESGPEPFACFQRMLQSAHRGPTGTPRIVVEN